MQIRIASIRVAAVFLGLSLVFVVLVWLLLAQAVVSTRIMSIDDALAEISKPGDSLKQHQDAEASLASVDPKIVLNALFDSFLSDKPLAMPRYFGWNDDTYPGVPADWKQWLSARRARQHAARRNPEFASRLIVEKLRSGCSSQEARSLIEYLKDYWSSDAEIAVVAILREPSTPLEVKFVASDCLCRHGFEYYGEIRKLTLDFHATDSRQRRIKSGFLQLVLDRSNAPSEFLKQDLELLHNAFEHLFDLRENGSRSTNSSRMFAIADSDQFAKSLGGFVGVNFEPAFGEPSYSALDGGLDPGIISDNAVRWWRHSEFYRNGTHEVPSQHRQQRTR